MHVKERSLSVVRVEHRVLFAGFCLSLYSLNVLNRDINIKQIQMKSMDYCGYAVHHLQLWIMLVGHIKNTNTFSMSLIIYTLKASLYAELYTGLLI